MMLKVLTIGAMFVLAFAAFMFCVVTFGFVPTAEKVLGLGCAIMLASIMFWA